MSFSAILREIHRKKQSEVMKYMLRLAIVDARQRDPVFRRERPLFLERARTLGYKAKQGFVIYSARIKKGCPPRPYHNGNTHGKCKNAGIYQIKSTMKHQTKAEMLAGAKCTNLRVLNSYEYGSDYMYNYYDVILVDPNHNAIRNSPTINWICNPVHSRRECRGLTSAGKKSRGLGKGIKYNNTIGGSHHAAWKRRNTLSLKNFR